MLQSISAWGAAAAVCTGAGVFSWAAVAPSAQLFGRTLRRIDDPSAIALTFDDGPDPATTPAILDLLERYGASATFFQIGEHVRAYPALAGEVARRGHTIGNHTDTHPRMTFLPAGAIAKELDACAAALESATGKKTRWMRPPYGYRGPQLERAVRKRDPRSHVVMWSASGHDWKVGSPDAVINRLRRVRGGDIVLLHDGDHRTTKGDRRHTIAAMEHWLPRWKDAGMRFVGLDTLEGKEV